MARRNDHTKEELRQMVIAAGCKIIEEKGFSSFSTRQIAKEIDYTVGTLYNIFDGYDDIILHINAATLDKMKEFIQIHLNPSLKADEQIKQLAELYIKFAHQNYNTWNALFEYTLPSQIALPQWYEEKIQDLFLIVANVLHNILDDRAEALKHAKIIWASIHGICVLSLTQKIGAVTKFESAENLTQLLVENYLRGLKNNT